MTSKQVEARIAEPTAGGFWLRLLGLWASAIVVSVVVSLWVVSEHADSPHKASMPRTEMKLVTDRIDAMSDKLEQLYDKVAFGKAPK